MNEEKVLVWVCVATTGCLALMVLSVFVLVLAKIKVLCP